MKFSQHFFVTSVIGLALVASTASAGETDQERAAPPGHWAFQPLVRRAVPAGVHAVDFFIDQQLRERGFHATPEAPVETLVRRACYDLHGLPPTEGQLTTTRDSFPDFVRSLLASPRYGERWGRHWLDVARYSDAKDGVLMYGDQRIRPFAYTYRDWVIRAFNDDKPFDEFIRLQIAADQLDLPPHSPDLAAMGFLTLGRMFDNNPHDVIDDQIDVVTRGFLGLTVSCARCHDHKFDPIPTEDYYSLYGIFASVVEPYNRPRIADVSPAGQAYEAEFAAKLRELVSIRREHYERTLRIARERTPDYLHRIVTTEPDVSETSIFFLSLLPEQLRPQITNRWRQLVAERRRNNDPLFVPWNDLIASEDPKLTSLAERWRQLGTDERIVAKLLESRPEGEGEIARAYGEVFRDAWKREESLKDELFRIERRVEGLKSLTFDLADIVAGGDGTGTGAPRGGLHPETGVATTGGVGFIKIERFDTPASAADNPYVESVFVPKSGAVTISSTGLRVDDVPRSSGQTWDYLKHGPSEGFTSNSIDGVDYAKSPRSLLGMHANKGVTFDLNALRRHHDLRDTRFRATFGHGGAKGLSRLDASIYVDGNRVVEIRDFPAQGPGRSIDVRLPASSRFLTLIVTEGAQGIAHDQAIWGDARLVADGPRELSAPRRAELASLQAKAEELKRQIQTIAADQKRDPVIDLLVSRKSPVWFPEDKVYYYLSRQDKDAFRGLVSQLDVISVKHPAAAARAMVVVDADELYAPVVFERGDPTQRGRPVPRRFLKALDPKRERTFQRGSGRRELADAIASPDNPLTARVWINRIWLHHFGEPLVGSPSDFGLRTKKPLHLELLDFLAARFIEGGWRTKPIHELIMSSAAYRRASSIGDSERFREQLSQDPENHYIWRAPRRRLDLEQIRDSLLAVSGELDETMYGRPLAITDLGNRRRTVYSFVERQNVPNIVKIFDAASPDSSTAERVTTTVPQQALFSMNSPFVEEIAGAITKRVASADPNRRVEQLYRITLGRAPSPEERVEARSFLEESPVEHLAQVLLMTNEWMFID
ncbi:MAG: DUF1553 domain-containing protein [Planctomycetota bacterium]